MPDALIIDLMVVLINDNTDVMFSVRGGKLGPTQDAMVAFFLKLQTSQVLVDKWCLTVNYQNLIVMTSLLHIFELHHRSDFTTKNRTAYVSIVHFTRGAS